MSVMSAATGLPYGRPLTKADLADTPEDGHRSPSTRGVDLLLKRERLERAGCAHYWVVDPDDLAITAWALGSDGRYREPVRACGQEDFTTQEPVAATFRPAELITS